MILKWARHREGLTQRELAELTGIPQRRESDPAQRVWSVLTYCNICLVRITGGKLTGAQLFGATG